MPTMDALEIDFLTPMDPNKTSYILSSPPFIKVDGAANFRDVGNLKACKNFFAASGTNIVYYSSLP
jgi:hypothetical protein